MRVFRNATLPDGAKRDVAVEDGTIVAVDEHLFGDEEIDATSTSTSGSPGSRTRRRGRRAAGPRRPAA